MSILLKAKTEARILCYLFEQIVVCSRQTFPIVYLRYQDCFPVLFSFSSREIQMQVPPACQHCLSRSRKAEHHFFTRIFQAHQHLALSFYSCMTSMIKYTETKQNNTQKNLATQPIDRTRLNTTGKQCMQHAALEHRGFISDLDSQVGNCICDNNGISQREAIFKRTACRPKGNSQGEK